MRIRVTTIFFLACAILLAANPCVWAQHTNVSAQEARELINITDDLIIIDVREKSEYCGKAGHIPGALNYPWNSGVLQTRYEELPIDGKILVVCQSGGRSNQAANFLDSQGFSIVYDMSGGMYAWQWETAACKYAGGSGTAKDPYQIATAEDLILLGESPEDYDKHFILTSDIDLDPNLPGGRIFDKAVIAPDENDYGSSNSETPFTGLFNGNGYVISNLHIKGDDYLGLFGYLDTGAKITNLGLETVDVNGTNICIGSLVGFNADGDIDTCYSTGMVTGKWDVGGLVGCNGGRISISYSNSTVSGDSGVGGLVGDNSEEITMSYSTGEVSGNLAVGGLVGLNKGLITTSYSTCMVIGSVETGGLVGQNGVNITTRECSGDIINCYSIGAVTGDWAVGGLVGANRFGNVDMSYSTGVVTDMDPNSLSPPVPPDDPFDPIYKGAGGLVGGNISNITSCFWDIETSGQTSSDGGEGKTTAEIMDPNTFMDAGWDFTGETINGPNDIWWILEGKDYPRLWWQLPEDEFEDGVPEPLWFIYNMEPELAWLEEVNGRLEANTAGAMENVDAIYVSDGWRLDANEPFAVRVDYHFSKVGLGDGRMTLGLVPTIEETVVQWAQFEVGAFDDKPFFLYEVRDDDWVREEVDDRFLDDGILYISYDPDLDELFFSNTGYGEREAIWTITGLIGGRWDSESLYITLGGGSEDGMALTGEDAWFDNFTIDEGAIVQ